MDRERERGREVVNGQREREREGGCEWTERESGREVVNGQRERERGRLGMDREREREGGCEWTEREREGGRL